MTQSSLPLVAYADLPFQFGITIEQRPTEFVMTIPVVRSWRDLSWHYLWGLYPLLGLVAMLGQVLARKASPTADVILSMAFPGVIVLLIATNLVLEFYRTRIIRITSETVSLSLNLGHRSWKTWPREKVYNVKLNRYTGKLLFHAHGMEMFEVRISRQREITEWVATKIMEALAITDVDSIPMCEKPASGKFFGINFLSPRVQEIILYGFMALIFTGAIIGFATATVPMAAMCTFGTILMAAFALGRKFGLQNKEYWF